MSKVKSKLGNKKNGIFPVILTAVIILFVAGYWWVTPAAPSKPDPIPLGMYDYAVDYTEYRIQQLMKKKHLPSMAVVLVDGQDIVWQKAYGFADIEKNIPATTATVYKLWSVAKLMTAIETMHLAQDNLVDLDGPITDYLPDFAIQSRFPNPGNISIRSILSHNAGLPRNGCYGIKHDPSNPSILGEIVKTVKYCQMAFPVGYRYKYSNLGPNILGYIIQKERKTGFAHHMNNALKSIGMEHSGYLRSSLPEGESIALGYEFYKGDYYPLVQEDINHLASGNLYSSPEDMGKFVQFIFRDGEVNGEQFIQRDTLQEMYKDHYSNESNPQPMGLGWKLSTAIDSEILVWHDGGPVEGVGALVALLPERKLGVVLMANEVSFEGSIAMPLAVDILELMLETKYGILPEKKEPLNPIQLELANLDQYSGQYILFGQPVRISSQKNHLKMNVLGLNFRLVPVNQDRFIIDHLLMKLGLTDLFQLPVDLREMDIRFRTGAQGEQDIMIVNIGNISYEICVRYPDHDTIPVLWNELSGSYDLYVRHPSGDPGEEVIGRDEIMIENNILTIPGVIGPILPISETEIVIVSGPFAGELIIHDPDTGILTHQWVIYKPVKVE